MKQLLVEFDELSDKNMHRYIKSIKQTIFSSYGLCVLNFFLPLE